LVRARQEARRHPNAKIIVSGGPVKGPAEGPLMQRWLVAHGVDRGRIIVESEARYTLDNARRVVPLMRPLKPTDVVLVTSHTHMGRSLALLEEELRTLQQSVRIRPSAAPEHGTPEQIAARTREEAAKTERDLATQRAERTYRLAHRPQKLIRYLPLR
jgi:hypothetical protein